MSILSSPEAPSTTEYQQRARRILDKHNCTSIGDLNKPLKAQRYRHYVSARGFDEAILDSRTDFQARCGYRWTRVPEINDLVPTGSSLGRPKQFCPLCWVIVHPDLFGSWGR